MKKAKTKNLKIGTVGIASVLAIVALFLFPIEGTCEVVFQKEYVLPSVEIDRQTSEMVRIGDWAGAMDGLLSALEDENADPAIERYVVHGYKAVGMAALSERKIDEAIENFRRGLLFDDQDPDLHLGMGLSHMMRSDYGDAEGSFKRALSLEPANFVARLKLGEIYYLSNNLVASAEMWKEALRIKPDDADLRKRLEKLELQLAMNDGLNVEANRYFSVVFDGEAIPELNFTVMEILKDAYVDIGQTLFAYPKRQVAVTLLTRSAFQDVTETPGWVSGLYEGQIKVPVAGYDPVVLKRILYHEYVHAVVYDMMSNRCPWWINEGLAQYLSGDANGNRIKKGLARTILSGGKAPSLEKLPGNIFGDPALARTDYSLALSAIDFFIDEFTIFNLLEALEALAEGKDTDTALRLSTGFGLWEFEKFWRESTVGW